MNTGERTNIDLCRISQFFFSSLWLDSAFMFESIFMGIMHLTMLVKGVSCAEQNNFLETEIFFWQMLRGKAKEI